MECMGNIRPAPLWIHNETHGTFAEEFQHLPLTHTRHTKTAPPPPRFVSGAYLGYGRGNAFLNDLLDADSVMV